MVDAVMAVGDPGVFRRLRIEFRHAPGQVLHLMLQPAQFIEDRHALGENCAAGEGQPVLREIANIYAFRD